MQLMIPCLSTVIPKQPNSAKPRNGAVLLRNSLAIAHRSFGLKAWATRIIQCIYRTLRERRKERDSSVRGYTDVLGSSLKSMAKECTLLTCITAMALQLD